MSEAETVAAQAAAANKAVDLDQQKHDRRDVEVLYKIYVEKRLELQVSFYESRVRENQLNADFTFTVGAAVMTISSLVATISAAGNSPVFSLLSAILPAFAALLASFRQLYGWERQISIYRDALLGLERVKLMTPDKDRMPLVDLPAIYPKLVSSGETVFTGEVNQWGQFVQNADKNAEGDSEDTRVTNALANDLRLSDEQIDTIRKIVAAGTPKPAFSEHTITVHPEETSALPSGSGGGIPTPATVHDAPSTYAGTPGSIPTTVTATHQSTTSIQPQESTNAFPTEDHPLADASAPITVTTTNVNTTVVEHVIPPAETAPDQTASEAQPVYESPTPVDEMPAQQPTGDEPPAPEAISALSPGAVHVDTPDAQSVQADIDALTSHHELANEPPPPEALSSLAPGAMHVDAPVEPPENPNPEADPNANG